jgi:hypothetical protein
MKRIFLNGDGIINLKTENFTQNETHDFRIFWFKDMKQSELTKFLKLNDVSLVDNRIVDNEDGHVYGHIEL